MKTTRRAMLAMLAVAALSACTPPPFLDPSVSQGLAVRSVTVDVSQLAKGVTGRQLAKTPAQIQADLQGALRSTLIIPGQNGGTADVKVTVTKVQLVSPGQSLLIGGNSSISGVVTVTGAKDGTALLAPTSVTAFSEQVRLSGLIGAASAPSAEKDYAATVTGFAKNVRARLLGGT